MEDWISLKHQCDNPIDGIYMFSANVVSETNYEAVIDIMKEDNFQVGILAYTSDHRNSAGGLCITECLKGETVWIKARYAGQMIGGAKAGSHFSGFLLTAF